MLIVIGGPDGSADFINTDLIKHARYVPGTGRAKPFLGITLQDTATDEWDFCYEGPDGEALFNCLLLQTKAGVNVERLDAERLERNGKTG
jgi:hypothetical protein